MSHLCKIQMMESNSRRKVTVGSLVAAIAEVFDLEVASVDLVARNLREAGLLPTSGRGRSAAAMGEKEIAVLLTALLVTDRPARATAAVTAFWGLTSGGVQFGEAFSKLISETLQPARLKKLKFARWRVEVAPSKLAATIFLNVDDKELAETYFPVPKAGMNDLAAARRLSGGMDPRRGLGEPHIKALAEALAT